MHFVYIKVPLRETDQPALDALHLALDEELEAARAGSVIGWGASVPTARSRLDDPDAFHRVDLQVLELESGISLLREALMKHRVPAGTELHFTLEGIATQLSLSQGGWRAMVPGVGRPKPASPNA